MNRLEFMTLYCYYSKQIFCDMFGFNDFLPTPDNLENVSNDLIIFSMTFLPTVLFYLRYGSERKSSKI